jgi:hypothetical protein
MADPMMSAYLSNVNFTEFTNWATKVNEIAEYENMEDLMPLLPHLRYPPCMNCTRLYRTLPDIYVYSPPPLPEGFYLMETQERSARVVDGLLQ